LKRGVVASQNLLRPFSPVERTGPEFFQIKIKGFSHGSTFAEAYMGNGSSPSPVEFPIIRRGLSMANSEKVAATKHIVFLATVVVR
jgi:hypothetical protein